MMATVVQSMLVLPAIQDSSYDQLTAGVVLDCEYNTVNKGYVIDNQKILTIVSLVLLFSV